MDGGCRRLCRAFCFCRSQERGHSIQTPERLVMASVLCTGADRVLLETRRLLLERGGHNVVAVKNEPELLDACTRHQFDVAVIGQGVSVPVKHRIRSIVRERCPGTKILELYPPYTGRVLSDADDWLEVPAAVPSDLPARVT